MDANQRRSSLVKLFHKSGKPGGMRPRTFQPDDTIIDVGERLKHFYFIADGTVGVIAGGGERAAPKRQLIEAVAPKEPASLRAPLGDFNASCQFAIIGARAYKTRTPSRYGYFALTTVKAYVVDSACLADAYNRGKLTLIVRALLHDSDYSSELKRLILKHHGISVPETTTPAEVDRILVDFEGQLPGGSYEETASSVVLTMLQMMMTASTDPSLIISTRPTR